MGEFTNYYCNNCGKITNQEGIFCQECGSRIDGFRSWESFHQPSQTPKSSSMQPQSQNSRDLFFLILAIITILLCITAIGLNTTTTIPPNGIFFNPF